MLFRHHDGRMAVVAMHPGDVPTGTLRALLADIGVSAEELRKVL